MFYSNNAAREAFVELCESEYVQKVTFDSYLYKKVRDTPFQKTTHEFSDGYPVTIDEMKLH